MTRHEFLKELHLMIRPKMYFEIGVQLGHSIKLALPETTSIGVDPQPRISNFESRATIHSLTSDAYFLRSDLVNELGHDIDLAFIDGMHLYEFALRDFFNIEAYSHKQTVVVFDDVLPRTDREASRTPDPGDWTGDVWKVHPILESIRPDLKLILVDVQPTGVLVVLNVNPLRTVEPKWEDWLSEYVPQEVFARDEAVAPGAALSMISTFLRNMQSEH